MPAAEYAWQCVCVRARGAPSWLWLCVGVSACCGGMRHGALCWSNVAVLHVCVSALARRRPRGQRVGATLSSKFSTRWESRFTSKSSSLRARSLRTPILCRIAGPCQCVAPACSMSACVCSCVRACVRVCACADCLPAACVVRARDELLEVLSGHRDGYPVAMDSCRWQGDYTTFYLDVEGAQGGLSPECVLLFRRTPRARGQVQNTTPLHRSRSCQVLRWWCCRRRGLGLEC